MGAYGVNIAGAAAGAAVNSSFGILSSYLSNKWAAQREAQARAENYEYNEKAAVNADTRTRLLYNDLYSPQAQMQQIKAAGLSPSMFYGDMAGISGQAGAQGAGATGISPTSYGINPIDFAAIAKMNAETAKIKEETNTIAGTNERGAAEIKQIVENTNNTALKNVWQEYQNALSEIELGINASLEETKIKNYVLQTEYLAHITDSAEAKAEIDKKSVNTILKYLEERNKNIVADTLLKKTEKVLKEHQINLTDVQIDDLKSQINVREAQLNINHDWLEKQVEQWSIQNRLTEKLNNAQIKKLVSEIWQGWTGKAIDLGNLLKR